MHARMSAGRRRTSSTRTTCSSRAATTRARSAASASARREADDGRPAHRRQRDRRPAQRDRRRRPHGGPAHMSVVWRPPASRRAPRLPRGRHRPALRQLRGRRRRGRHAGHSTRRRVARRLRDRALTAFVAGRLYGDGVTAGETGARPEEVRLTNLDEPLFDGAEATERDLVDYLEAIGEQLLGELRDRPLSVIRALRGQKPFMQKNVPKYTPPWVRTVK